MVTDREVLSTELIPHGDVKMDTRDIAVRTAWHYRNLTEQGVPRQLARSLTDRYHQRLMTVAFGSDDEREGSIGFTDAVSHAEIEQDDDDE